MTRRVIATLLLGLLFISTLMAQKKTGREEMGLVGAVRTLLVETEEAGKARVKTETVSFDQSGKTTEAIKYSGDGTVQSRTVYSYDAKGNLIGEVISDAKGVAYWKESHSYDANGQRTETQSFDRGGKTTGKTSYTYDTAGRLTEESHEGERLFGGRSSSKKTTYSYDNNGRLVSKRSEGDSVGMGGRIVTSYQYDYDGRLVGQNEGLVKYTYNSRGNLTEKISGRGAVPNPGPFDSEEHYSYEYDPQGNWVKQTVRSLILKDSPGGYSLNRDIKLMSTTYRTITYY